MALGVKQTSRFVNRLYGLHCGRLENDRQHQTFVKSSLLFCLFLHLPTECQRGLGTLSSNQAVQTY